LEIRMRGKHLLAYVALVLGSGAGFAARAVDPATLANAGTGTIAACASCHGKDGGGQASFPRLAGMNASYLLKQLADFDSGARANGVMQPIAKALSAEDRLAITRYYAAMPVPATQARPGPASDSPGEKLALLGKWEEGVPACVQCHGPGGIGVGDSFPAIAAQPAGYITAQLRAWQAGTRKNDPIELMRHLSAKLSAAEIKAVSEWFSLQPATAGGGSR
jgi:cytochrome c553